MPVPGALAPGEAAEQPTVSVPAVGQEPTAHQASPRGVPQGLAGTVPAEPASPAREMTEIPDASDEAPGAVEPSSFGAALRASLPSASAPSLSAPEGRVSDRPGGKGSGQRQRTRRSAEERAAQVEQDARQDSATAGEPVAVTGTQRAVGAALGRRPKGLLAVALAGVVVLVIVLVPLAVNNLGLRGEGAQASAQAESTVLPGDGELSSIMEVAGDPGGVPVVSLKGRLTATSEVRTDLLTEGSGRTVAEGDPVLLSVSTFSGIDGRNTTGTDSGVSLKVATLNPELGQEIDAAVKDQKEGSRIVLRSAHEESSTATTEITVIDILPTTAVGEERPATEGMPQVSFAKDGTASLSVKDLPVPERATIATLIQGEGRQIGQKDVIIARHSIVRWSDGKAMGTSSYGTAVLPRPIDMTNTLAGISQLLVDVPVGSRVVLALPAEQARGEDAEAVVIDILGIIERGQVSSEAPAEPSPAADASAGAPAPATPTPAGATGAATPARKES
ncbi:Peptidylprolyl isomerase [Actinomyces slackii]|uniref:Peptidylprolyl isomerase n=2 Tax=Actinomyces slackii TaxID=52774 RepID=A0A3S4WHL8_9ACTO|nr:Uncharacterised protein [Actinomyces slackii]